MDFRLRGNDERKIEFFRSLNQRPLPRRQPFVVTHPCKVFQPPKVIPEGELQDIFEAFHRGPATERGESSGLGLGLATVDRLASALGIRVVVRSTVGKGSVFLLELPVQAAGARRMSA
jgi:hypothetical protein